MGYVTVMPSVGVARATVSTVPRGVDSHEVKRQRTLRATDSDWERVGALARAAGMTVSDFVLWRALEPPSATASAPGELPERLRDRIFKAVLVLWELERRRLADTGDAELWTAVNETVDEWFENERKVG